MESKQLRTLNNEKEYFTPWNDEHQQQLYSLNTASKNITMTSRNGKNIRRQKFKLKQNVVQESNAEDKAKKTLIDIGHQQKNEKVFTIKQFLQKKSSTQQENTLPKASLDFKLPVIKRNKSGTDSRVLRRNRDSSSAVSVNKINIENDEDQIFKKYGSHRKKSVERSISIVSGIKKNGSRHQLQKKYETLDVSMSREKNEHSLDMKHLKLRGKKYSYEFRNRNMRRDQDQFSYLPNQPNITPHHILFGFNQEDVFKKVFKQLSHKFK